MGRFKAAVEHDSSDAVSHMSLGTLARRLKILPVAARALRRAAELLPEDDGLKYDLGNTLAEMGEIDEAEAIFCDLLEREARAPMPSRAKLALANLILNGRGQRSRAFTLFCECIEASRPDPSPLSLLAGVAADSMGDHSVALGLYRECWSQDRHDEYAALHLMVGSLRQGDEASAAALRATLPSHVVSSVEYVLSTSVAMDPSMHFFTYDMLRLAAEAAKESAPHLEGGLVLEFGVYHGMSIRMLAQHFPHQMLHGFDTFSGIPEDWHSTGAGAYSTHGVLPEAPDNVAFHAGLFSDTLPGFLRAHPGPIRFMNIDCDLYSSTRDVFDAAADRIRPGTVIVFDEYVMNPHWRQDEYRAFQEAVVAHGWKYKYLGISLVSQQAAVQIL